MVTQPPSVSPRRALRERIERPGTIIAPSVPDPLTARLAQRAGFEALALGGYTLGAHLLTTEPLIDLAELASAVSRITRFVALPLIVDAGAGYGEALHTSNTIRELERAGASAAHIEDQHFPKRAHYHRGVEQVVPVERMVPKIRAAAHARRDPDFVLIARTDCMRTEGYEEGIRRAKAYHEAGADLVMVFPNDESEAKSAPRDANVPLVYTNSQGGRFGRPVLSRDELTRAGYSISLDAQAAILTHLQALEDMFAKLVETGLTGSNQADLIPLRDHLEEVIGLEEAYQLEEETVERLS
jgi:2-methylisocitrate lyase-like PEP mutase family enzyme